MSHVPQNVDNIFNDNDDVIYHTCHSSTSIEPWDEYEEMYDNGTMVTMITTMTTIMKLNSRTTSMAAPSLLKLARSTYSLLQSYPMTWLARQLRSRKGRVNQKLKTGSQRYKMLFQRQFSHTKTS